jgi:hypothetical protein
LSNGFFTGSRATVQRLPSLRNILMLP